MAHILIVDDDPSIQEVLSIALSQDQHSSSQTTSIKGATQRMAKEEIDLAIVDLRLGRENGIDLLKLINSNWPFVPVLIITAYADSSTATLHYRLFIEFLGFKKPQTDKPKWPKKIRPNQDHIISAAGHALYSTHPHTLQVLKSWTTLNKRPFSIHLSEHPGEVELLTTGRGEFTELMKHLVLPENFIPPGISPVAYADQLGILDKGTLAV